MSKLLIIIILGTLLRVILLDQFPNGFSGDEAGQGYSAYSISKTGKDEWGAFLPLSLRGFGDFKPPIYTYLTVPSVTIFGLSEFSVRLPAAIIGTLTILLVYFLVKEWFKDQSLALWSSFLLSINPWHIQISRTAFEGGAGIFFFCLGFLFFLKAEGRIKYLIWTAIFWGFTLYSYHSFRVFMILFIIGLMFLKKYRGFLFNSKKILIGVIFGLMTIPIIFNFGSSAARASDVGIFSEQAIRGYFENRDISSVSPLINKIFDNKFLFVADEFYKNYLSYFSPTFFFTGDRPDYSYLNFPYFPLLYPIEIIFWIAAICYLFKRKDVDLIILWIVVAGIPAALAAGVMSANRASPFLPLVSIISAFGVKYLISLMERKFKFKIVINVGLVLILILSFISFLRFYFTVLPQKPPPSIRYGYEETFRKILKLENQYDKIVISKSFTQPQIFVAFYGKINPIYVQEASRDWLRYEKADKLYIDQLESWNLGKFLFEGIFWEDKSSKRVNALVVGKPEEFPENVFSVYDVKDPKGKILYRLVSTNQ